jgi:hypothetical protein
LKGTTNLKLLRKLKQLAPQAKIIVTAETIELAKQMYEDGAHYVILNRLIMAHYFSDILERIGANEDKHLSKSAREFLNAWDEVLE